MPELPEVETVRRGLQPALEGRVIVRAETRRPDLRWPFPERMAERLTGRRAIALRRRSKYILAELDGDETLIVHLGMSGRISVAFPADRPSETPGGFSHAQPLADKHDHVVLETDEGVTVTYNDARRFGAMDLAPTGALDAHRLLAGIGPEPLGNGFDESYLADRLHGRNAPVKAVLLDQRVVAGLGNIYVCEALFRAGIAPRRKAGRVSPSKAGELVRAIREVLRDAIEAGGSSLRDYRRTDGELGYFQHVFSVYGREGMPCPTPGCAGVVRRIVQSGRSSFYCPRCQR